MGLEADLRTAAARRRARFYAVPRPFVLPVLRRQRDVPAPIGEHSLVGPIDPEPSGVPPCVVRAHFAWPPMETALVEARVIINGELTNRVGARVLMEVTARETGVSMDELVGPSRLKEVVSARHLAMWRIAMSRPDMSLPQIGRLFGDRDHTTVLHGIRRYDAIIRAKGQEAYIEALCACRSFTVEEIAQIWSGGSPRSRQYAKSAGR